MMWRLVVCVGALLLASGCSSAAEPASTESADPPLASEPGWLEVAVDVDGANPRTLTGWYSPSDATTVRIDDAGDVVMRADADQLIVPSFLPDSTAPWTSFDLVELDAAVQLGVSPLLSEPFELDTLLSLAGAFAGHPSVDASAQLLDAALAVEADGGQVVLGSDIAANAWATPTWVTMLVDCRNGLEVDVVVGDGEWTITHAAPTLWDPTASVDVVFRRGSTEPPPPDARDVLALPRRGIAEAMIEPGIAWAPCSSPAIEAPAPVDCSSIASSGRQRGVDSCEVLALLVERQAADLGAVRVTMRSELTVTEMLGLPLNGIEITAFEVVWSPAPEDVGDYAVPFSTVVPRLEPPAAGPGDAARLIASVNDDPLFPLGLDPVVSSFQIAATWGEIGRFIDEVDVASVDFSP